MKKQIYAMAALLMGLAFVACDNDNEENEENDNQFNVVTTTPLVDQDSYPLNTDAASYSNRQFGQLAIDNCLKLNSELEKANSAEA